MGTPGVQGQLLIPVTLFSRVLPIVPERYPQTCSTLKKARSTPGHKSAVEG